MRHFTFPSWTRLAFAAALLCALGLAIAPSAFAATPTYVRPGGDDTLCNGTADADYAAGIAPACAVQTIQKGIDLVDVSGTVHVRTGIYVLSAVVNVNKAGITLDGDGAGATIVQVSGTGERFSISAAGVTLQDFEIVKTDKTGIQNIIRLTNGTNVTIKNNTIHGQFVIGDGEVSRALIFDAGAFSGVNIEGNTIYALRQPAYISGTHTGTIQNNYVYGTKGWVLEGGNLTFTGNTWGAGANANVYDIAILSTMPAAYYTDIVAMSNANNGAVIENQRVSPAVLSAVYVDAATAYTTDLGGRYHPYSTISPAITRVVSGGTIYVATGTYPGNITINKSMSLLGDPGDASAGPGPNAPMVDGGSAPGDAFLIANGVSYVTIQGFEIRNFTSNDTGIGNGISAWEASTSKITIQDNYFHDLGYNAVLVGNDGAAGDHTNWLIKKNIVANVDYIGFELTNTSNSSIEDNIIHLNSPDIGAIFSSARRSETGLTIKDNLIDGTPSALYPVVYIYAYDLDMANPNLDGVLIEGNTIATTGTPYQIFIRNIGTGTITGVEVHYNSMSTLKNATTALVDAEHNYWGTVAYSEIAPKISGSVDWSPWCNSDFTVCTYTWPVHNITQGIDYQTIQAAVNAANSGDQIHADAGTYVENVIINKPVTLVGAGAGSTIVMPAISDPNCGGAGGGSLCTGSSNIFLVQANDVTIQDLTVDGDNPGLTSGIVRSGADLDARNGIITNHSAGVFNNLAVHHVTVKNIYLRGIYASSGGSFNLHHNTVQNVKGESASIGIFNFYGAGIISDNVVSDVNDAIAANWSSGTQFLRNTVTDSSSGLHTDNNAGSGGSADLLQDNVVTNCKTNGYGMFVFAPYAPVTVNHNTVTNCAVGLALSGQASAVTPLFTNNIIDGQGLTGATGVYVTTSLWGWGDANVSGSFTANQIVGNDVGFYLEQVNGKDLALTGSNNQITDNNYGVYIPAPTALLATNAAAGRPLPNVNAGEEIPGADNLSRGVYGGNVTDPASLDAVTTITFFNNDLSANADSGVVNSGSAVIDASGNWWGAVTPADVAAAAGANVDYTPWLADGADTSTDPGFQGDFSALWVDDDSPQTGTTGRIQEGINLVAGSTLYIADGLYKESNMLVDKTMTVEGESRSGVVIAPAAEDANVDSAFGSSAQNGFVIKAHDVTITKLTLDGQGNPDLTAGKNNFRTGIVTADASYPGGGGAWNNLHVDGVTIKYPYRRGISVFPASVSGTLIQNSRVEYVAYNHGMYVAGQSQVLNNEVHRAFQGIVQALDTTTPAGLTKVNGNTLTAIGNFPGCWGYNSGTGEYTGQPRGIQFNNSDSAGRPVEIIGNTISDNGLEAYGGAVGIYTRLANAASLVQDNVITLSSGVSWAETGSQAVGMLLGWSYDNGFTVRTNHVNSTKYGIGVMIFGNGTAAHPLTLEGNIIASTSSAALDTGDGTGIYIANQYLFAGDKNPSYVILQNGNRISGYVTGVAVEHISTSTYPLTLIAHDNCIFDNTSYGLNNTTGATVDATGNWWGDASGPYNAVMNSAGAGNAVSDDVDFVPWFTDGCPGSTLSETTLSATTADALFCTGETTTVAIDLAAVADLYGYQFEVTYDATKASAAGAFVNSFFDTMTYAFINPGWNADCTTTPGTCKFSVVKLDPGAPVSGSGILANITFTGVAPGVFDVTIGADATLTDRDGQALAHTLSDPLPVTVCGYATISGYITMQGRFTGNVDTGTVSMVEQTTTNFGTFGPTIFSATDGAYTIQVPYMPGGTSYKILAEHGLYLDNEDTITVSAGLANKNTRLWGGDANNSGKVEIGDLSCIGGSFGLVPPSTCGGAGGADINADGKVNVQDLAIAGGNYDKVSPQPW